MSEKWVVNCEGCKNTMVFYSRESVREFCIECEKKNKFQLTNSYLKAKDAGEVK
jgi:hypothetical protein